MSFGKLLCHRLSEVLTRHLLTYGRKRFVPWSCCHCEGRAAPAVMEIREFCTHSQPCFLTAPVVTRLPGWTWRVHPTSVCTEGGARNVTCAEEVAGALRLYGRAHHKMRRREIMQEGRFDPREGRTFVLPEGWRHE